MLQRSMRSQMREANRLNVKYSIIIGDDELQLRTAPIKNMDTGKQINTHMDKITNYFIQK